MTSPKQNQAGLKKQFCTDSQDSGTEKSAMVSSYFETQSSKIMKTPLMKSRKISITSSFKIDQDKQLTDTIVQRSSEDMYK